MFQATLLYSFLQYVFFIRCRVFICLVDACFKFLSLEMVQGTCYEHYVFKSVLLI